MWLCNLAPMLTSNSSVIMFLTIFLKTRLKRLDNKWKTRDFYYKFSHAAMQLGSYLGSQLIYLHFLLHWKLRFTTFLRKLWARQTWKIIENCIHFSIPLISFFRLVKVDRKCKSSTYWPCKQWGKEKKIKKAFRFIGCAMNDNFYVQTYLLTVWVLIMKIAWWLHDNRTTISRQLLDDCLMTAWWLPDVCLMTPWWLPDDCLTTV